MDYRKIVRLLLLTGLLALVLVRFADVFTFGEKVLGLLTPLIIGFVIAFLVDLLVRPLERLVLHLSATGQNGNRPIPRYHPYLKKYVTIFFPAFHVLQTMPLVWLGLPLPLIIQFAEIIRPYG